MVDFVKIQWQDIQKPKDSCRYDHVLGYHPMGVFQIEWKSWKEDGCSFCCYSNDDWFDTRLSLEEAMLSCQEYIDDLLECCISKGGELI